MRPLFLAILILFSLAIACTAQEFRTLEQSELDMPSALKIALENNPVILESMADLGLAGLRIEQAYLQLSPTVSLSAAALAVRQTGALGKPVRFFEEDLEATVNVPLYTFGQVYWNAKAAKLARNQSTQDLRNAVENMLQTVQTAYIQARLNEDIVEVTKLQVADRQAYKKQATDLFDAGEMAEFEIIQAEANVLSAQEGLSTNVQNANTSKAQFLLYLGVRPDTKVTLKKLPDPEPPPDDIDEGLARAIARRPEVVSLRWQLKSQLAQAKANRRQNAPTLSVYGDFDNLNEGVSYTPTVEAGLQLSWQIFDGGYAKNAEAQALKTADKIRQELIQEERQVSLDVVQAYAQMTQLWPQIDMAKRSMEKAKETLQIAQVRFQAGLSDGVELLSAQDGLSNARTALAQAEANYRLAQVNWRKAISADYPIEPPPELEKQWEETELQTKDEDL
jgi:outer membrane protein TolC